MREIRYQASPTAQRFHASDKVCRGFRGPVGNGKSVACIMELFGMATQQAANSEGKRKSRFIIVRNTYPELSTTTLKTFQQWIPDEFCAITMSPIIKGVLKMPLKDGTHVESEFIFLSIDRPGDERKLLSLECTGIFLNEARELEYGTVRAARERIGRYPSKIDGYTDVYDIAGLLVYDAPKERNPDGTPKLDEDGEILYTPCTRKALIMDTNSPGTDHWWYRLAEVGYFKGSRSQEADREETARVFDFFSGPSPLIDNDDGTYRKAPGAENIANLPGGYQYYLDMVGGNSPEHINVMVLGNYGTIMDGKPVYPQYNDRVHCPEKAVGALYNVPICLGWDFGLTPSCVIGQLTPLGQCRIITELMGEDMGIREFARDVVKPYLQMYFADWTIGFSLGDPSGNARGEGEGKSAIGILNDRYTMDGDMPLKMGFDTDPAPTNDPTRRIDAVTSFMTKMHGEPGYLLSHRCIMLRKGKLGLYHYKRVKVAGPEQFRDKPNKNIASHLADAEQYLCLGFIQGYVDAIKDVEHDVYDDEIITRRRNIGTMGYN